ncbi:MalY/PatB family protein [Streptomyces venezuelae]|uniref:MalY/PatB family protein n=1 Tax=Streptomyces venezuelae TaxID=54571 RepID=UPI0037A73BD2
MLVPVPGATTSGRWCGRCVTTVRRLASRHLLCHGGTALAGRVPAGGRRPGVAAVACPIPVCSGCAAPLGAGAGSQPAPGRPRRPGLCVPRCDRRRPSVAAAHLRRRTSGKWHTHPPEVLPLTVGEMDVQLAPPVRDALIQAVEAGDTGFAGPQSTARYARAFRRLAQHRWGWDGAREADCHAVPDIMRGLVGLVEVLTRQGDAVVVNTPAYPDYFGALEERGGRIVEAPLSAAQRLDPDTLDTAFQAAAHSSSQALYLLCSPHNPTGTVHRRDELEHVAALARRYGVRVIADEAHALITWGGARFTPYLSVSGSPTALALQSPAKAFNLGGLNGALAIAGEEATDVLARLSAVMPHGRSHLAGIAHCAAMAEGEPWLDALLAGLEENRRLLQHLLHTDLPAVKYAPPDGTIYAWIDCRPLQWQDDPAELFLTHGRVAVISGRPYRTGGDGHVRLNMATTPELLAEAVRRMAHTARRCPG